MDNNNFSSISIAIIYGRNIYNNLKEVFLKTNNYIVFNINNKKKGN